MIFGSLLKAGLLETIMKHVGSENYQSLLTAEGRRTLFHRCILDRASRVPINIVQKAPAQDENYFSRPVDIFSKLSSFFSAFFGLISLLYITTLLAAWAEISNNRYVNTCIHQAFDITQRLKRLGGRGWDNLVLLVVLSILLSCHYATNDSRLNSFYGSTHSLILY